MSWDAQELAKELAERFGILTKEAAMKDAAGRRLPIPSEAMDRALEAAAARLLKEYPFTIETLEGWDEFFARKPSFAYIFARLGDAMPPSANAEKATPDREALAQYIGLGFTLYAQEETKDRRRFVDWRQFRYNTKDNSKITDAQELDAALKAGIVLFGFQPKERGFVCLDIDCGHEGGGNGWESYRAFLKNNGIERGNPLEAANVIVDTPSGGNHLYFLARENTTYAGLLCDCVEVFGAGTAKTLTAAGSVKKGKVYRLRGNLKDATPLPRKIANFLAKDIFTEQAAQAVNQAKSQSSQRGYTTSWKSYPVQSLAEKVEGFVQESKANKRGRNNAANYAAMRLGWQVKEGRFSEAELYNAIKSHPELGTLPESELRTAFNSGMSISRKQERR